MRSRGIFQRCKKRLVQAFSLSTDKTIQKDLIVQVNQNLQNESSRFERIVSFIFCCGVIRTLRSVVVKIAKKLSSKNLNYLNVKAKKDIPPLSEPNKKTLVLDLDETLVHSQFDYFKGSVEQKINFQGREFTIFVKLRPFLAEFLKEMSEIYELILFTASLEEYAGPVINRIDPNGDLFKHLLFRENCTFHEGFLIKDMSLMNRNMKDLIIVDNSAVSFAFQPENAFHIKNFFFDDNDRELESLTEFLKFLANLYDVRHVGSWHKKYLGKEQFEYQDMSKKICLHSRMRESSEKLINDESSTSIPINIDLDRGKRWTRDSEVKKREVSAGSRDSGDYKLRNGSVAQSNFSRETLKNSVEEIDSEKQRGILEGPQRKNSKRRNSADEPEEIRFTEENSIPIKRGYDLRKESLEEGSSFLNSSYSESPIKEFDNKRYSMDDSNMNSPVKAKKNLLPYII